MLAQLPEGRRLPRPCPSALHVPTANRQHGCLTTHGSSSKPVLLLLALLPRVGPQLGAVCDSVAQAAAVRAALGAADGLHLLHPGCRRRQDGKRAGPPRQCTHSRRKTSALQPPSTSTHHTVTLTTLLPPPSSRPHAPPAHPWGRAAPAARAARAAWPP